MRKITLNGQEYSPKEPTLHHYVQYIKIVSEKNKKVIGHTTSGEEITEDIEDTEEFLYQKRLKIIDLIYDIPLDLEEYPDLVYYLTDWHIFEIDKKLDYIQYKQKYYMKNLYDMEFKQYIVMEEFMSKDLLLAFTHSLDYGQYNEYWTEYDELHSFISDLPYEEYGNMFNEWLNQMTVLHNTYPYIFNGVSDGKITNVSKHCQLFGWQEVLRSLAESQVFGTYTQTKSSKCLEVLEYLNVKASRDEAEYQDMKPSLNQ